MKTQIEFYIADGNAEPEARLVVESFEPEVIVSSMPDRAFRFLDRFQAEHCAGFIQARLADVMKSSMWQVFECGGSK